MLSATVTLGLLPFAVAVWVPVGGIEVAVVLRDRGAGHGGALHQDAGLCGGADQRHAAGDVSAARVVGAAGRALFGRRWTAG
jgi:hypothetical protein